MNTQAPIKQEKDAAAQQARNNYIPAPMYPMLVASLAYIGIYISFYLEQILTMVNPVYLTPIITPVLGFVMAIVEKKPRLFFIAGILGMFFAVATPAIVDFATSLPKLN